MKDVTDGYHDFPFSFACYLRKGHKTGRTTVISYCETCIDNWQKERGAIKTEGGG